jgi:excinuclease UvrABC nuclease subunit
VEEKILVKKIFGPYPSGQYAKESLKVIRKIFPFRDKCTPFGFSSNIHSSQSLPQKGPTTSSTEYFQKTNSKRPNPCFSYQIGLCPGVCCGVCDKKKYKRIIERLITFLEGDGEKVRQDLEEDMKSCLLC